MTTVAEIAQKAFNAVSASITDAVHDATLTDGVADYAGRVVFGGEKPAGGFPMSTAKTRTREAYLEGFGVIPTAGWSFTSVGVVHYVLGVIDIVRAGSFSVVNSIAHDDMLWQAVTIERQTNTSDGAGGYTKSWSTFATQTAGIVALSGSERWASDRIEAMTRYRMVLPYIDGLKASDRVAIVGKAYAITFIDDVELRGKWMQLDLTEGAAT
jgi:SPP1 family predicted phage head-tail adaptor